MAYSDPAKETKLLVDASPVGIGVVLTQEARELSYTCKALYNVETRKGSTSDSIGNRTCSPLLI